MELKKQKYDISLSFPSLIMLMLVNLPDLVWVLHPAENDILINKVISPPLDIISTIFIICFNAQICIIVNQNVKTFSFKSPFIKLTAFCLLIYYLLWIMYYDMVREPILILAMDVMPCVICGLYAYDRKNCAAFPPLLLFTVGHLSISFMNIMTTMLG